MVIRSVAADCCKIKSTALVGASGTMMSFFYLPLPTARGTRRSHTRSLKSCSESPSGLQPPTLESIQQVSGDIGDEITPGRSRTLNLRVLWDATLTWITASRSGRNPARSRLLRWAMIIDDSLRSRRARSCPRLPTVEVAVNARQ